MYDIVIPLGPNDIQLIQTVVKHCSNIQNHRNIYIVSYDKNINIDGAITVDENIFPFNKSDIISYGIKKERDGWYLQQLIKLYAGFVIQDILDDYLVIDSDTIFLKEITFMIDSKYCFTIATENHTPYFIHMNKLHQTLKRYVNLSGIAHHMIFNKKFVNELFKLIEDKHNIEFWKAFLKFVDPNQNSGASEYEIYFNFMIKYHPELFIARNLNRKNTSDYSEIERKNYDYISIHWYIR
jgi:hypothetical protein